MSYLCDMRCFVILDQVSVDVGEVKHQFQSLQMTSVTFALCKLSALMSQ